MRYLSVCSGIEAATAAWKPLGWEAAGFAEIDKFPSAVLSHHYPNIPNHGDFTTIKAEDVGSIDLLVGGTPCQSFSVAGLRGGLDDDRGNLALEFLRLAQRTRPRWLVWENVPGVLSSNGGRDFGSILGGMVELGYGIFRRVLDAQYFGLAQRRKRVFVVGYLGDWRPAAAVLLERESLSGHPAPRRKARQDIAPTISARTKGGGGLGTDFDCDGGLIAPSLTCSPYGDHESRENLLVPSTGNVPHCLNAGGMGRIDYESETLVTHALRGEGFDASEDGTGRGTPLVPVLIQSVQAVREKRQNGIGIGEAGDAMFTLTGRDRHAVAFSCKDHGADAGDLAPTPRAMGHDGSHANAGGQIAVAFHENQRGEVTENETAGSLKVRGGKPGQGYPAVHVKGNITNGHAPEARSVEALRALREAVDEETLSEWIAGIVAAFWPQEVLQSGMHGGRFRQSPQPKRGLVNVALSRQKVGSFWSVQDLWQAGCDGCPPQGWQPSEQLAQELGAALSELPYAPSPAERFLQAVWPACEGSRVLRETLSTLEEARRSACGKNKPKADMPLRETSGCTGDVRTTLHASQAVRRLVVEECEALQGFPRGFTLIPYRKGWAADGPRYKALGNSMAVPVMSWLGRRIQSVDAILSTSTASGGTS